MERFTHGGEIVHRSCPDAPHRREIRPQRGDRVKISDFCTLFSLFPAPPAGIEDALHASVLVRGLCLLTPRRRQCAKVRNLVPIYLPGGILTATPAADAQTAVAASPAAGRRRGIPCRRPLSRYPLLRASVAAGASSLPRHAAPPANSPCAPGRVAAARLPGGVEGSRLTLPGFRVPKLDTYQTLSTLPRRWNGRDQNARPIWRARCFDRCGFCLYWKRTEPPRPSR